MVQTIEMLFGGGADSRGSKEPVQGADPSMVRGTFDGGHVPAHCNVPTAGECACAAHVVNECIRRREE